MKAAWYETQGDAQDVLVVGQMPDPHPGVERFAFVSPYQALTPAILKSAKMLFNMACPTYA